MQALIICNLLKESCLGFSYIKGVPWVHAYLHRVEGDLSNAAYWYNRAVQPVCKTSLATEWEALYKELSHIERKD